MDENVNISDERARLDAEWGVVNALPELAGIALRGTVYPTYEQALSLGGRVAPEILAPDRSILARQKESDRAREYIQKAEAKSTIEGRAVTPVELVDNDIAELDQLISVEGERDLLEKRKWELDTLRHELAVTPHSETQLIFRDFNSHRELPLSGEGRNYREFALPNGRALRIRVLHPDPPEHATGADLIYEQYRTKERLVRLAAIQYKIWQDRRLYKEDRLEDQLNRMRQTFCGNHLCEPEVNTYRLPHCSAFLRPTDKLQLPNSRLISSGYHIPVCVVEKAWQATRQGGGKLVHENFKSEAVTQRLFEEHFNNNMLGSRWLNYEELEGLYRANKIMNADERVIIHAQDFSVTA